MESNQRTRPPISLADGKTSFLQTLVDMSQPVLIVAPVPYIAAVLAQPAPPRPDLHPWIADLVQAIRLILNGGRFASSSSMMT
jgi:hypothetical protein